MVHPSPPPPPTTTTAAAAAAATPASPSSPSPFSSSSFFFSSKGCSFSPKMASGDNPYPVLAKSIRFVSSVSGSDKVPLH